MTNITKILEKTESLADFFGSDASELIDLFMKLQDLLPQLQDNIEGAQDPWSTYEAIRDGIGNEDIKDAFAVIDASDLYDSLKSIADAFGQKLPNEAGILLRKLGHFGESATGPDEKRKGWSAGDDKGLIAWDVSGKIASAALKDTSVVNASLGVTGSLDVSVEAGSLWFYKSDRVSSKGLIRMGIVGKLGANLEGKMPFGSLGSIGAKAEAGVAAQAHLFYRRPEDDLVGIAIADVIKHPVNIFSLEEVLLATSGPDDDRFEGFIMAIDGHTSLDIDLAVARDIDVKGLFNANAGLTVSVDVARKAAYELSVRAVEDGVKMVLSHADEDSSKWGVGVGIEIDASAVLGRVAAVVQDGVEHWDSALKEVTPFLSPGTWLQTKVDNELGGLLDKLSARIGDEAVEKALRNDLKLLLGLDASSKNGVAALFEKKVREAIGSLEDAATENVSGMSKKVIAKLVTQLPAVAQTKVQTKLEAEVKGLLTEFQNEFEAKLDDLAKGKAKEVSKALEKVGVRNVSSAANKANDRVKKLRELVEKTNKLVHEIAKAVEEAAKAKITARLRFEKARIENEQYEITGTFTHATEDAKALYRAIMLGRLDGTKVLFDRDGEGVEGFAPDESKCSVRRFGKVSKAIGYEAVFLGVNLAGGSETSGSADVEIGLDNKITVRTTSIATRNANLAFGKSRKTEFLQTGSILLAKAEKGHREFNLQRSLTLDLSTQHQEKKIKAKNVEEFLELLHLTKLIDEKRQVEATNYVANATNIRGSDKKVSGTALAEFGLDAPDAEKLLELGSGIPIPHRRSSDPHIRAKVEQIIATALGALLETREWNHRDFDWFAGNYIAPSEVRTRMSHEELRQKFIENFDSRLRDDYLESNPRILSQEMARYRKGKNLHKAIVKLIELVGHTSAMLSAEPSQDLEGRDGRWGMRDYRDGGLSIAKAAEDWIGTNQWGLIFFGKGMDQRTVAFMLTLARLCGTAETTISQTREGLYDKMVDLALVVDGKEAKAF